MRQRLKLFFRLLLRTWRLSQLASTPVWQAAELSVKQIGSDSVLRQAAEGEPRISFCPRCGQRPVDDRRHEHARECALDLLQGIEVKHAELDLALAWQWWWVKKRAVIDFRGVKKNAD